MPELPEVETTRIGIAPHVLGERIADVRVREPRLRWRVPKQLKKTLTGQTVCKLGRRAKYLLFYTEQGCMILHLGMSGSLRIVPEDLPPEKHEHFDLIFESRLCLRLRDPRRFGSIHWTAQDPLQHPLLKHLGPEPLSNKLNGEYLFTKSRKRTRAIKTFIMDSRIVVGIGNIYSNEALFAAGIYPKRSAGKISAERYAQLSGCIKEILNRALAKGGTTLRDFVNGEGKPGYFRHELQIYDHAGEPCPHCKTIIKTGRLGQRSIFYCPNCQH